MTQSFIQPKGSLNTQVNVNGLQNQLAQMFANQQLQGQAQQQAAEQDPLRQTVNELVKNKLMQNIEVPRFTTIQDIVNARQGSKLETFGKYLGNNPDITRLMGTIIGGTYIDRNGKFVNAGDELAKKQEMDMLRAQQEALASQKEQNDLAQAMANAYNQKDIHDEQNKLRRELAKEELEWKRQENALDRELRRQENAENRAMRRELAQMIHGGNNGGSATGGAAGVNDLKMTAAERKQYTEGKTTLSNIEAGLKALEENPKAYTFAKGLLPSDLTNRIDPKGVATRAQIDNITAVYRKWLTGAQMSDKERKAYERFLPAPTDNYNIVKAKLNGMKGAIERSNDAILSNYGVSSASMSTPSLNVDRNSLEAEMKRRGLK